MLFCRLSSSALAPADSEMPTRAAFFFSSTTSTPSLSSNSLRPSFLGSKRHPYAFALYQRGFVFHLRTCISAGAARGRSHRIFFRRLGRGGSALAASAHPHAADEVHDQDAGEPRHRRKSLPVSNRMAASLSAPEV